MTIDLAPISDGDLAELWFALRNSTWRAVTSVVRSSGADQKQLAERIDMDPGQFNRIITGTASNPTLRTLHKIARAANHRLRISLEPLAGLSKPNYSYDAQRRDRVGTIDQQTLAPLTDGGWTRGAQPKAERLEAESGIPA